MFLSDTNLRYLFVIDDIARKKAAVSSMEVAQALGVTKPSVARVLESLMERGLVVKERYGKVYLTDRGAFTARYYHDIVWRILHSFPEMPFPLTEEQKYGAACAMAAALLCLEGLLAARALRRWPESFPLPLNWREELDHGRHMG